MRKCNISTRNVSMSRACSWNDADGPEEDAEKYRDSRCHDHGGSRGPEDRVRGGGGGGVFEPGCIVLSLELVARVDACALEGEDYQAGYR